MRRFGIALLWAVVGYGLAAIAGDFLILRFSANVHDRSVEAAMTSAFVLGPAGAVLAFVAGLAASGRGRRRPREIEKK